MTTLATLLGDLEHFLRYRVLYGRLYICPSCKASWTGKWWQRGNDVIYALCDECREQEVDRGRGPRATS
jgi:hypothetical protein